MKKAIAIVLALILTLSVTAVAVAGQIMTDDFTVSGRYVRITVTGLPANYWASFYEFSVFGGAGDPGNNIALNKTASADSEQAGHEAANGNDDDTDTRWCADDGITGHWWEVDLGSVCNISGTKIMWEKAGIFQYKIDVSNDNSTWTTVVDKTKQSSTLEITPTIGGNLKLFLSDQPMSNGFTNYQWDTTTYFYFDKAINPHVTVGAGMAIWASESGGSYGYDTYPWVCWNYDPLTVWASRAIGERISVSDDLDSRGGMYYDYNDNDPGVKVRYKINKSWTVTGVLNSTTSSGQAYYRYVEKFVYSKNGFTLGGGYASHSDVEDYTGGWDVFTSGRIAGVKFDAEYEARDAQISPTGATFYQDNTSAFVTNASFSISPVSVNLKYFNSLAPGFRAISDADGDPYWLKYDIDPDYNMFDYVRRYGIEAQIVGVNAGYKLTDTLSANCLAYRGLKLGTSTTNAGSYVYYDLENVDKLSYKVSIIEKPTNKLTATYSYKNWDLARQLNLRLNYNWASGVDTSFEAGYGKTREDVNNGYTDHWMWIARMILVY